LAAEGTNTLGSFESQSDVGTVRPAGTAPASPGSGLSYQRLSETPDALAASTRPAITGVSHIALYATDLDKAERFYVNDLGGFKAGDPENPRGVRYYFASTQFVEVMPMPAGPASINRLDHVAFTPTYAEGLRKYLASREP